VSLDVDINAALRWLLANKDEGFVERRMSESFMAVAQ
jgi:hypothetical protein